MKSSEMYDRNVQNDKISPNLYLSFQL